MDLPRKEDEIDKTIRLSDSTPKPPEATQKVEKKPSGKRLSLSSTITNIFRTRKPGATAIPIFSETPAEGAPAEKEKADEAVCENLREVAADYEIGNEFAAGGQGTLYRATDRNFHRTVAVKSLNGELKDKDSGRKAFLDEAVLTARLEHPSIVPVYGIYNDREHGLHLAMKLIKGKTLKQYLRILRSQYNLMEKRAVEENERVLLPQRLDFFLRVCEAISYIHSQKVIHRDLKPENIMIGDFNETYIMDLGIARRGADVRTDSAPSGTLQYIAPEVINRQPYDSRSDIYLLGLILYEIVFLKPAYPSVSAERAIANAAAGRVQPYVHEYACRVDSDLGYIIRKALKMSPVERYQTAAELSADVKAYLRREAVKANPHRILSNVRCFLIRRYRLLLGTTLTALLLFMSGVAYFLFNQMQVSENMRRQEEVLASVYSKGILSASLFDNRMQEFEGLVCAAADEAAIRLEETKTPSAIPKFYAWTDGLKKETAPPGLRMSSTYGFPVDMDRFCWKESPGEPVPDRDKVLARLEPLKDTFFSILTMPILENQGQVLSVEDMKRYVAFRERPPFHMIYMGLESGLYLCYPYNSDNPEDYDPRGRPWYRDAVSDIGRHANWTKPYADIGKANELIVTCSRRIVSRLNGKILGAIGADISLLQLVDAMKKLGNTGPSVTNSYLINADGSVILDTEEPTQTGPDGTIRLREFKRKEVLKKMFELRNGRVFSMENNRRILYFFMRLDTLGWLYIERIDFQKRLEEQADRK